MYPDILDIASEQEERERVLAIQKAKDTYYKNKLKSIGVCHNCEDEVGKDVLFCEVECQEDYEFRESRQKANIKVT